MYFVLTKGVLGNEHSVTAGNDGVEEKVGLSHGDSAVCTGMMEVRCTLGGDDGGSEFAVFHAAASLALDFD